MKLLYNSGIELTPHRINTLSPTPPVLQRLILLYLCSNKFTTPILLNFVSEVCLMMVVILGLKTFFAHLWSAMGSVFFAIISILAYLIGYPAKITLLTMALAFFCLDFLTRAYAIKVQNGGLFKALVIGKFSSRAFINGFITKILAYFTILVSAHFAEITPELGFAGDGIASILYCSLFFYELISNMENLIDAGLKWLQPILKRLRKEQDNFIENETEIKSTDSEDISNNTPAI